MLVLLCAAPRAAAFGISGCGQYPPTCQANAVTVHGPAWHSRRSATPLRATAEDSADELLFGLPRDDVARPLALLLFSQLVLFVGVGAVIPTIPIFGKSIGLTGAANGVVLGAPALALLLGAQPCGRFADQARKPAMMIGMGVIAVSDLGTAFSTSLVPLVIARLGLGIVRRRRSQTQTSRARRRPRTLACSRPRQGRCISESGERGMLADLAARPRAGGAAGDAGGGRGGGRAARGHRVPWGALVD